MFAPAKSIEMALWRFRGQRNLADEYYVLLKKASRPHSCLSPGYFPSINLTALRQKDIHVKSLKFQFMRGIHHETVRQDLQHRHRHRDGGNSQIQAQAMVRPILTAHPEDKNRVVSGAEEI
jgi:hypothetical protein